MPKWVITIAVLFLAAATSLNAEVVLLYEDFSADEDPPAGWFRGTNGDDLWMRDGNDDFCDFMQSSWEIYDEGWVRGDCHDGDWMQGARGRAFSNTTKRYQANAILRTPFIDCSSYDKVRIEFQHTYRFMDANGTGRGEAYGKLTAVVWDPEDTTGSPMREYFLFRIEDVMFVDWHSYSVDVSWLAPHWPNFQLKWKIELYADNGIPNFEAYADGNWFIDNVWIIGDWLKPDNCISDDSLPGYIGENIINLDGTDQTLERVVDSGDTLIYDVKITELDWNYAVFLVTGPGSSEHWTIQYFDRSTGEDITDEVTGMGWSTPWAPQCPLDVKVIASPSAPPLDTCDVLVTASNSNGMNKDAVLARTMIKEYRPDNLIARAGDSYIGNDIYNDDATNQVVVDTVDPEVPAVYNIKIENDSRNWPEAFTVTGTGDGTIEDADYVVRYYDAPSGGNDITSQVTGSGWSTGQLAVGASKEIRVEVTPQSNAEPDLLLLSGLSSRHNPGQMTFQSKTKSALSSLRPRRSPVQAIQKSNAKPTLSSLQPRPHPVKVTQKSKARSNLPPITTYDVLVTTTSSGYGNKVDVVKASTMVKQHKPDNLIANAGDDYLGDNIYNNDGTDQTVVDTVDPEQAAVYNLKIENDSKNWAEAFTVIGTGDGTVDGADYQVRYFDAVSGRTDITADITGSGWSTGNLAIGASKEIRVEVTPQPNAEPLEPPPITTYDVLVASQSSGYGNRVDVVKTSTTVKQHKPDNWVKVWNGDYTGDDIYNDFDDPLPSSGQTAKSRIKAAKHLLYHITIQNDGNTEEPFTVTGTAGGTGTLPDIYPPNCEAPNFTVKYYEGTSVDPARDITSDVTGSGWNTGNLDPYGDGTKVIMAEVIPDSNAWGFETYNIDVKSVSDGYHNDHGKHQDIVRCSTTIKDYYQPDNLVKRSDKPDYVGDHIYNDDGVNQTASYVSAYWTTVTFYIKIENDTNTIDHYTVTGTDDSAGYRVRYYDALSGGTDITSEITGAGWNTEEFLPYGGSTEIRLEVTGSDDSDTTFHGYITSISNADTSKHDVVKVVVIRAEGQPDEMVKYKEEKHYLGDDTYNTDGYGQTSWWSMPVGKTAVYHIRIENDYCDVEENPDEIWITGDPGNDLWTVKYYDALTDGIDITSEITGTGWVAARMDPSDYEEMRIEVTPNESLSEGDSLILSIMATSGNDPNRVDVVKVGTIVGREGPGVSEDIAVLPPEFSLKVINPIARAKSTIQYTLPYETELSLNIYDATGRVVKTLASGKVSAGFYSVEWRGRNNWGKRLSQGIYFCRMKTDSFIATRKLVLLR